jgi:hypothetical protein
MTMFGGATIPSLAGSGASWMFWSEILADIGSSPKLSPVPVSKLDSHGSPAWMNWSQHFERP